MEIAFRARNVDIPDRVRGAIRSKVTRLAGRWCIDRAEVCFSEERNPRIAERERCAITLWGPQHILRAEAAAADASVAANRVMGVLERRANKLVGRLTVHFLPNRSAKGWRSAGEAAGTDDTGAHETGPHETGPHETGRDDEPVTPEDAALEMLACGRDRWHFVDVETGRPSVLYRRGDTEIEVVQLPAGARWEVR